jgi:Lon protease-like protein
MASGSDFLAEQGIDELEGDCDESDNCSTCDDEKNASNSDGSRSGSSDDVDVSLSFQLNELIQRARDRLDPPSGQQNVSTSLPEPASHSYLLGDADCTPWRSLIDAPESAELACSHSTVAADCATEIPLYPLEGVVLFPGDSLPLIVTEPRYLALFHQLAAAPTNSSDVAPISHSANEVTRTIGFMLQPRGNRNPVKWCRDRVGTVAEVVVCRRRRGPRVGVVTLDDERAGAGAAEDDDDPTDRAAELAVVCVGVQRFRVSGVVVRRAGVLWAPVTYLTDRCPQFLSTVYPRGPRLARRRMSAPTGHHPRLSRADGSLPASNLSPADALLNGYELASAPSWAFRLHDPEVGTVFLFLEASFIHSFLSSRGLCLKKSRRE